MIKELEDSDKWDLFFLQHKIRIGQLKKLKGWNVFIQQANVEINDVDDLKKYLKENYEFPAPALGVSDIIEIKSNATWLEHILIDKILAPIFIVIAWIIVISKLFVWLCIDEIRNKKPK